MNLVKSYALLSGKVLKVHIREKGKGKSSYIRGRKRGERGKGRYQEAQVTPDEGEKQTASKSTRAREQGERKSEKVLETESE